MIKITNDTQILIISPHPDDESIGVGGFLSFYGKQCDVLLLTDGSNGKKESTVEETDYINTRYSEFSHACSLSGVRKTIMLNIKDGQVDRQKRTIMNIELNFSDYDFVLIPNRYENHIDHMAVYPVLKRLLRKRKAKSILIEYEVWTPLRKPDFYLDISTVANKKKAMIEVYASQNKYCDFPNKALALNSYRGMASSMDYAEAFCYAKRGLKSKLKSILPFWLYMFLSNKNKKH